MEHFVGLVVLPGIFYGCYALGYTLGFGSGASVCYHYPTPIVYAERLPEVIDKEDEKTEEFIIPVQ